MVDDANSDTGGPEGACLYIFKLNVRKYFEVGNTVSADFVASAPGRRPERLSAE